MGDTFPHERRDAVWYLTMVLVSCAAFAAVARVDDPRSIFDGLTISIVGTLAIGTAWIIDVFLRCLLRFERARRARARAIPCAVATTRRPS
jgi:hypothetical protein